METYTAFAGVYDKFMDNIDYEQWFSYLRDILKDYGIVNGIIADIGCGTGNMTQLLSKAGYDMIGIDNSEDMLSIAASKLGDTDNILYLNQDMREMELYGSIAAAISVCDSINYITEFDQLVKVFSLVNNYLDLGGVFVFDLKTKSYFERIGESVIAEDREDCSFIWDNYFDFADCINEYILSIFVKESDGRYDKYTESHYQKAYSLEEIRSAIEISGLKYVTAYNAFTRDRAEECNDRIYVIAQKN